MWYARAHKHVVWSTFTVIHMHKLLPSFPAAAAVAGHRWKPVEQRRFERSFLALIWRCNKKGDYVSLWLLYESLHLHLCVIKHENDYFCAQRQDEWPLRGKPQRKSESVCVRLYLHGKSSFHFFVVEEYQCLKKTPEERAEKNAETFNISFITEPPISSFLSILSYVLQSPPSAFSFTSCLIAAERFCSATHKFENEPLHYCDIVIACPVFTLISTKDTKTGKTLNAEGGRNEKMIKDK